MCKMHNCNSLSAMHTVYKGSQGADGMVSTLVGHVLTCVKCIPAVKLYGTCNVYCDVQMQRKSWNSRKDVVSQPFVTPIHFAPVIIVISDYQQHIFSFSD